MKSLAQLLLESSTRSNYYYISGDFDGAINIQVKTSITRISEAGIGSKEYQKSYDSVFTVFKFGRVSNIYIVAILGQRLDIVGYQDSRKYF